ALNGCKKPLQGSRVCVLGVAYKKDLDDPRESPAFPILEQLQRRGAIVTYHDPLIPTLPPMRHHPGLRLDSQPLTEEFLQSQDCVAMVTDHSNIELDRGVRFAPVVGDPRNGTANLEPGTCRIHKA